MRRHEIGFLFVTIVAVAYWAALVIIPMILLAN